MGKFQYNEALASLGNNLANAILMKRQREEDEQRKAETEFNISRYLQALMPQEQMANIPVPLNVADPTQPPSQFPRLGTNMIRNESVNQGMAGIQGQQQNQALAQLLASGQGQQLATIMQLKKMQQPDWREVGTAQTGIDLYDPSNPSNRKNMFPPTTGASQQPNSILEMQTKVAEATKNGDMQTAKYWQDIIDKNTQTQMDIYGQKRELTNEGIAKRGFNSTDRKITTYTDMNNKTKIVWQRRDGTTYETEAEGTTATTDMRNRATATKKAEPVLNSISELSDKINTGAGLMAKITGEKEKLAAKINYDDDVAEYNSLISGFTPLVARALGHTGVLTEQDVQSVKEMFPKPGDSKTLRDRKISRMKKILGEIQTGVGATQQPTGTPTPDTNNNPNIDNDPLGIFK